MHKPLEALRASTAAALLTSMRDVSARKEQAPEGTPRAALPPRRVQHQQGALVSAAALAGDSHPVLPMGHELWAPRGAPGGVLLATAGLPDHPSHPRHPSCCVGAAPCLPPQRKGAGHTAPRRSGRGNEVQARGSCSCRALNEALPSPASRLNHKIAPFPWKRQN